MELIFPANGSPVPLFPSAAIRAFLPFSFLGPLWFGMAVVVFNAFARRSPLSLPLTPSLCTGNPFRPSRLSKRTPGRSFIRALPWMHLQLLGLSCFWRIRERISYGVGDISPVFARRGTKLPSPTNNFFPRDSPRNLLPFGGNVPAPPEQNLLFFSPPPLLSTPGRGIIFSHWISPYFTLADRQS